MQIDFYILAENSRRDYKRMVCQLCEKALAQHMQVMIYTKSIEQAQQLDELLWSFKADSFLAHYNALNTSDMDSDYSYPIIISSEIEDKTCAVSHPFLINLSNEYSDSFLNFKRIAEMVSSSSEDKQAARKRYRFYLDKDYSLNKYDL